MSEQKRHPSDLTDAGWAFVAPYLTMLPEDADQHLHEHREAFDAVRLDRAERPPLAVPAQRLPPPWGMVYQQTRCQLAAGCFEAMVHDLRALLGIAAGLDAEPTAAVLDSRTPYSTRAL